MFGLVAGASQAAIVQGYANGHTLVRWCGSENRLDAESCLSYLRGIFDALEAMPKRPPGSDDGTVPDLVNICVPPTTPIHQPQIVVTRFLRSNEQLLGHQGGVIVIKALRARFPCPA